MKKTILQLLTLFVLVPLLLQAQVYIDSNLEVEAKAHNYKLATAPTIDGSGADWESIPWQYLNYNDKDFNGDGLADPSPGRLDFVSKFKAAWVDGSNILYLLVNIEDDQFVTDESINWYNSDGLEIRVDPFDEEVAGEPGENPSSAFNIGFRVGQNEASGIEGTAPSTYEAIWTVDEDSFPKVAQLELAITLNQSLVLQEFYNMGFHLYVSDNDANQDDSPGGKDAATVLWPQLINAVDGSKIGVDAVWEHTYLWGNLECITINNVTVASGASIQTAVDAASEGTIINLETGLYTENVVINKPYIQLVGTAGTILKSAVPTESIITIANDDVAYGVIIKNIKFDAFINDSVSTDNAIRIGSAQARILNNEFYSFEDAVLKGDVDSSRAHACVFEDNFVTESNGGLALNTANSIFRYNSIEENTGGYGFSVKGLIADNSIDIAYNRVFNHHGECAIGYGGKGTFTIHNNMILRSETLYGAGDTSGDDGIENQDSGGSIDYIYNNTIVGWKSDGIQMGNGSSTFFVRNNLIAHCGSKDYDIRTVGATDIDYGLSFSNGTDLIPTLGAVALTSDPLFTDELEDDFTITTASPAVDAGLTEPFGFKVMYFGEGLDIGAFETGSPITSIDGNSNNLPTSYSLEQNYPNPFNPSTVISFSIPKSGVVTLKIYNILGQEVATLINNQLGIGTHTVNFNAASLSTGMYIYSIQAGEFFSTKKMMLMK